LYVIQTQSTTRTNEKKLFFLLSTSETFSEDDQVFRNFYQKRFDSVENLRDNLEGVFTATMRWLLGEVFRQDTRGGRTEAEIKQDEFEEGYARDMEEAVAQMQR
jgi:hypothetical protein